jgi:hypothetical protein
MRRAYFPAQQSEIPEQKTSNSKIPRADLTFFISVTEFFDINFNKKQSFAQCYSQSLLLAEIIFFSGFRNPYKNIRKTRKPSKT